MKRVVDNQQKGSSNNSDGDITYQIRIKRFLFLMVVFFGIQLTVHAQFNIRSSDMFTYSQQYPWGTARSMGMSGAFGALGADQSSLSINPAGIGFYRTSDLSLTLSLNHNNAESSFFDNKNSDFSEKLNIGNLGYVYTYNTMKDEGWVTASFGIAYNRVNDFNRNVVIKNPSASSSLLDEFVYYANGEGVGPVSSTHLNENYEGLAYEFYAIDKDPTTKWYISDFTTSGNKYGQYQERRRDITGGIGEYTFSAGANYSHQLYIGATFGVQDLSYDETTTHTEVDQNNNIPNLQSFVFTEYFSTTGTGYNFKFGAIYKPVDLVRLGLAVHSPTFYSLNSEFSTSIETFLDPNSYGNETYHAKRLESRANYNSMSSPWKTITSIALVQPFGLIDFDYEHLDYSTMRLYGDGSTGVNSPNDYVKSDYKGVNNIRVGAEIKAGDFAIRGGFGYYSSPYSDSKLTFIDYKTYSAGIGYRGPNFYMDLGYTIIKYPDSYRLYTYTEQQSNGTISYPNNPTIADINYNLKRITATFGYKF